MEQSIPEDFSPPPTYELAHLSVEILFVPVSPSSVQSDTELVQKGLHDVFGSELELMDVYSGTDIEILNLNEDLRKQLRAQQIEMMILMLIWHAQLISMILMMIMMVMMVRVLMMLLFLLFFMIHL